jgi:DNA-binding response OmpR family regulator
MGAVRILLVDDEAPLADLLQRYLERLGYQVDACLTAEDAVARFEQEPGRYTLVLTDLTLPGMGGDALLARLRETDPQLRAIVSSGYPYQPTSKLTGFLQKPFLPRMLVEEIEAILKT